MIADLPVLSALDRGFALLGSVAVFLTLASLGFALLAVALRVRHDMRARRWDRMTRAWEPALLEVLAGVAEPADLFDRVEDGQGPDFLTFLMTYVRRLRGAEQAQVRQMAAPFLPALVPLLSKGTDESRGNAVLLLARMGMPEYANEIAGALEDESAVVSMVAANSLFRPGHERHFPEVLEHLPRFAGWSRSFLSGMLAAGGPGAAPLLRSLLLDREQRPEVRAVSADALRALNDLDSVDLAVHILENEREREVSAACLRLLKQLGHADHTSVVRRLTASLDPVMRATAVSALGALGNADEAPTMLEMLDDPSFWVSLEAARGLIAVGERGRVEKLAAAPGPWSTLARQVLTE